MADRTKIDWCDASWNPVTGCLHGCEYCYARKIAKRFSGCDKGSTYNVYCQATWRRVNPESSLEEAIFEIDAKCPPINLRFDAKKQIMRTSKAPYPWGFNPTLHRELLDVPQKWKKPRTIFVCSMADLFGAWVPDSWIEEVLAACRRASHHRYLFLTKNPDRYDMLIDQGLITPEDENFWLGSTCTVITRDGLHWNFKNHTFMSCEPILEPWPPAGKTGNDPRKFPDWVILGAETGIRKDKVIPPKEWIDNAVAQCRNMGVPVFMKGSLREIMGADFVQEYPWRCEDLWRCAE